MSDSAIATIEMPPIRVRSKFFFEGDKKWFLKGVTCGPFRLNADGDFISTPEVAARDFAMMRELGINLIRVYHVPPRWLLDLAARQGLRVLVKQIIPSEPSPLLALLTRVFTASIVLPTESSASLHFGRQVDVIRDGLSGFRPPYAEFPAQAASSARLPRSSRQVEC